MKEIFLISITLFLVFIVALMLIRDKKKKKKKNQTKKYNVGEQLTIDKNADKKNAKLFNRKAKSINFNEGKSHSGQGIIGGQIKKQKQQEELKKPIGWVQAKSYEEDVKSSNVIKYVHEEDNIADKTPEQPNISFNKTKPNILVVDDSITILKFISSLLVKINYEIITKEDGLAALDFLNLTNRLPDLIITDLEMPKMAGNELVKIIRKESKFKNIPILIVSSNPEPHIYLLEDELVNGIIKKPFDKEDFMNQVKYLINN
jgi:CheY-like chemotaxis protein